MNNKPHLTRSRDILIERAHHYCRIKKFTSNIAKMFTARNQSLLSCKYLDIEKKLHAMDANKQMLKFCKLIQTQELNDDGSNLLTLEFKETKEKINVKSG
jgi:hypothetical protein